MLVRNTFTSVDPGMRLRLRESGPAGYFNSFPLNAPMDDIWAVGEVIESRAEGFEPGDSVWHAKGWRDYAIVTAGEPALAGIATLARIDTSVAPAEKYLGPLGAMGVTAYAGLIDAAELREGDVVWVSAAAGAVGSLAAQIAKLRGHRVIGSAGIGGEGPLPARRARSRRGVQLPGRPGRRPAARSCARRHRRVLRQRRRRSPRGGSGHPPAAGVGSRSAARSPSTSRPDPRPGPSNLFQATANNLTLRGFRGSAYQHRLPDVVRELGGWLADGRLRYPETIIDGLERAPEALMRVMSGDTTGKALVRIA